MKKTVLDFLEMKKKGDKMTFLTSYDYPTASLVEKAGVDMILVGDSAGMVVYGYKGTIPMTMDTLIGHCGAVRRGAPNTFVIGDMPFLSYQISVSDAVYNAGRFYKEGDVDAIKLEGGRRVVAQVEAIVNAGMAVMGHVGLTPQSSVQLGGFKAQGRTADNAVEIIEDAIAIEKAGVFAILVEGVPPEVGKIVTEVCKVPILGIGAGMYVDGQCLIISDMLGFFEAFTPRFVKKYANLADTIQKAITAYVEDVKGVKFPEEKHCYRMIEGEADKLKAMVDKRVSKLLK